MRFVKLILYCMGDQIFVGFLSMKIYLLALHGVFGIANIFSAWFLDIRISTCLLSVLCTVKCWSSFLIFAEHS